MSTDIAKINDRIAGQPAITDLARHYGVSAAAFVFTFRSVAMPKDHSEAEFISCCLVAKEHGLNPLTKELYFMRTRAGAIQPIVSVDGWMRKLNEHPQFDGIEFTDVNDDKGRPVAVTCTVYRKDRLRPTKVTEHLDECEKSGNAIWKSHPRRMLRHRALTQAARYAVGFSGVMDADEFQQWQGDQPADAPAPQPLRVAPKPAAAVLPDLPDIPDEAPEATSDAPADDPDDQSALLRELQRRLDAEPKRAGAIEREFASALMAMDEDGRAEAVEMIQAAKAA